MRERERIYRNTGALVTDSRTQAVPVARRHPQECACKRQLRVWCRANAGVACSSAAIRPGNVNAPQTEQASVPCTSPRGLKFGSCCHVICIARTAPSVCMSLTGMSPAPWKLPHVSRCLQWRPNEIFTGELRCLQKEWWMRSLQERYGSRCEQCRSGGNAPGVP